MDTGAVNRLVLDWYATNSRDLPWRRAPYLGDAYAVLVSEVMLQQTQVDRTVPKFIDFMAAFPTVHALAAASPGDVIALWSGMGYNNRAVRLQRLAAIVVAGYEGEIPRDVETLLTLPDNATLKQFRAFEFRSKALQQAIYMSDFKEI